jgi:predicted transcriptional regulator
MRTIRFPEDVDRQLQEVARAERSSVNRTVVVAVERYIRQMNARRPKDTPDGR